MVLAFALTEFVLRFGFGDFFAGDAVEFLADQVGREACATSERYRDASFLSSSSPRKRRSLRSMRWRISAATSVVEAISLAAASMWRSGTPRARRSRAMRNSPCLRDSARRRVNCLA